MICVSVTAPINCVFTLAMCVITRVLNAMRGVDFVFHAAALKQVPSCGFILTGC